MSLFDEQNQPTDPHSAGPEHQLDLLVDNELSESDRRDLLVQLEHEPDGWRRCALAFLEAQCLKSALPRLTAQAAEALQPGSQAAVSQAVGPVPQPQSPAVSPSRQTGRWRRWQQAAATALTIAASVLIAVVIGLGLSGNGHFPGTSTVASATANFPLGNPQAAANGAASNGPANPASNWEMVTLSALDSPEGKGETFSVPAQSRDTLDPNQFMHMPEAIPPQVRQALEQSGHRVVQQREIVPVEMSDGRRLVVPVDHVEIHLVDRQSF